MPIQSFQRGMQRQELYVLRVPMSSFSQKVLARSKKERGLSWFTFYDTSCLTLFQVRKRRLRCCSEHGA